MCKVLIAHNLSPMRQLLSRAVIGLGHKPIEIQTIAQALVVCDNQQMDLVVTGTALLDGEGYELLRKLCEAGTHCMAIVFDGGNTDMSKYNWRELHVFDVVTKSLSFTNLSRKIEDALDLTSNHERVIRMLDGVIRRNALVLATI